MKTKTITIIAALAAISACAKSPEDIAAIPMQGQFNCAVERAELARLEQDQRSARNSDTWGVLLLGIPVSSLFGGDVETKLAVAKGRVAACK